MVKELSALVLRDFSEAEIKENFEQFMKNGTADNDFAVYIILALDITDSPNVNLRSAFEKAELIRAADRLTKEQAQICFRQEYVRCGNVEDFHCKLYAAKFTLCGGEIEELI